jgi:hypothetical protein
MSFLDSLENNLKALESQEPGGFDNSRRQKSDRAHALATAPWADRLKNGPYVKALMRDLTRAGFERRMKVNFVWLGTTLRMEALGERIELQPGPGGVEAVAGNRRTPVNLDGSPDSLIKEWLALLDEKRLVLQAIAVEIPAESDDE